VSDPKGETPRTEHPMEDDLLLDFSTQHEEGAPLPELLGQDAEIDAAHPVVQSNVNASTDDFQFTGPLEELDFTEPADFTFPSEAIESGAVSDSSANMGTVEHAGLEDLLSTEEAAPQTSGEGEAVAVSETEEAPELVENAAEEAPKAKPKRELPAWVHALEWTTVALLSVGSLIALFVSIIWLDSKTATLILNIAFPVMLASIPFALWRSSRRWLTPSVSALYTVLLAIGAAALIGGAWFEGMELASYNWQFNKARLAAAKPRQQFVAPVDPPAGEAK
jgi:hypothetical protein